MFQFTSRPSKSETAGTRSRRVIAFDGDDTLWIDDSDEKRWERDCKRLCGEDLPHPALADAFRRQVSAFGYTQEGVQRALIESAREVCGGEVPAEWRADVDAVPGLIASLNLRFPPGLEQALDRIGRNGHALWIITMGDLVRQAMKLCCFPFLHRFDVVEIVERKDAATYLRLLAVHGSAPPSLTMVGDAFFQDVVPVVRLGGRGIHVPAGRWKLLRPLHLLLPTRRIRACRDVAEVPDAIAADG
jgi:putative hydrolase of the HAD superfamily